MTERELPPDEWHRLIGSGTPLEACLASLDPRFTKIAVVEDDAGQIIGSWGAFLMVHGEGVHIAEAHRGKAAVARHLWRMMRKMAAAWGADKIVTGEETPEVKAILEKRSVSIGQRYVLPMAARIQ